MPDQSLEWKRILTGNAGKSRERVVSAVPDAFTIPSANLGESVLLQAYEQIFLEKERLMAECAELRKELRRTKANAGSAAVRDTLPGSGETAQLVKDLRSCVNAFQEGLRTLDRELSPIRELSSKAALNSRSAEAPCGNEFATTPNARESDELNIHSLAKVVAEWVYSTPDDTQVQLVEDALESQGIMDLLR